MQISLKYILFLYSNSNEFIHRGQCVYLVMLFLKHNAGILLGMGSANERWLYNVTSSLIGQGHTKNDPYNGII